MSGKSPPYPNNPSFLLNYPLRDRVFIVLRGVIVLHFTLRSMIRFELIFVNGVRSTSTFTFLHVDVQWFQPHLLTFLCSAIFSLQPCQ